MTANELNKLFELAQKGDLRAEALLFARLNERFRYIAAQRIWNRVEAEEVVQYAMLIIAREYKTLTVTASFAAWAYKVLDNRLHTYMRSYRTDQRRINPNPALLDAAESVSEDLDLRRRLSECLRMMCQTNRQYARVLNYFGQGYDATEICSRMHLKQNSFYSMLRRGRAMLLKCLETGRVK